MWSASFGRLLTILGVMFITFGVCSGYVLERTSSESRDSNLFQIFEVTFFPVVLVGLLLVVVGCCVLAVQLAPKLTLLIGLGLLVLAAALSLLGRSGMMPLNVHDWTASLLPPLLALLPLALVFVAAGIVRVSRSRKD